MTHEQVRGAERTVMTESLFALRGRRGELAQIPVEGTAVDGADRMVIGIGMAGLGDPGGEIRAQRRGCGVVSALVGDLAQDPGEAACRHAAPDRKSTRLNSSHVAISYAVFCLKKKTT